VKGSDIFNIINKDSDVAAYVMRISYCLIPFCGIPVVYFAAKEAVEKIVIEYKFRVIYSLNKKY
jgi:hypothetical protein